MNKPKVILVTGATRGIGFALANKLAQRGDKVYGTGRKAPVGDRSLFIYIAMDLDDERSVKKGIDGILRENPSIDVLINNAGIGQCGPVEETTIDAAKKVFETNYWGMVRSTQAVLPHMRKAGDGLIVNVSSAAGKIALPFQAHYCASKFAVEGLTEALYHEVKPYGIRVVLVEPGDVGTSIWEQTDKSAVDKSEYRQPLVRFLRVKENEMGAAADSPANVATQIIRIMDSRKSPFRNPVARGAAFVLAARKLLPDGLFMKLTAGHYKV
ncbi:MAG TPA: SDR family oxidoreductase [Spirochaetota bacterium]|nr:SDR family oxidoreductase [Spirochaetota bacterium]